VDGDAGDFGEAFLDAIFEGGGDVVDAGDGEIAFHDAVAGDEGVVLDLANADVVAIDQLIVFARQAIEKGFDGEFELTHLAGAGVGRGDVPAERFDVDVDVGFAIAQRADAFFEFGGAAMGFAEAEVFVHFEMEFHEKIAVLLRSCEVMNGEAHSLGNGADGFKEMFVMGRAGFSVNDDVGGNDFADTFFDGVGEDMNLFEAGGARDGNGGVDEMAIAGAAGADAIDGEDARHMADRVNEFTLQAGGGGIEKSVERAAAELRTDPENHAGDGETRERVSINERGDVPDFAGPDKRDPENDDDGAPNIGGEMERIGFEGFAGVLGGDDVKRTGAGQVNRQRDEENKDGHEAELNVHRMKEEAREGFIDNVERSQDEQTGFDESGEIFKFAVAVRMTLIGGLVRNAHGKKRDHRGDQVEAGMQRFGEHAEAARAKHQKSFQAQKQQRRTDAEKSGPLLFLYGLLKAAGKDHALDYIKHASPIYRDIFGVMGGSGRSGGRLGSPRAPRTSISSKSSEGATTAAGKPL